MSSTSSRVTTTTSARLIIGALLIAALAPYARTLAFGFVMDDTTVIRSNPDLDGWGSLWRVWTHPYGGEGSPYFGLYRPLTMALFALVWNAGGHWALWFHLLAISLHACATLVLWRVLERGVGRAPAVLGALWFAVHPLHVEAVANVANSSEILVAISTCLLTLHLARADEAPGPVGWEKAATAGALYLAAFLSKESGAVAPVLAVLALWGWRRNPWNISARAYANRWWRVLVAWTIAAAAVLLVRLVVVGGPITGEPIAAAGLGELSTFERATAMLALGPRIAVLLIWPGHINPHYGPTTFATSAAAALSFATILVLGFFVAVGARLARRGDGRLLTSIAWIVIAFLPASNILVPTGQILAERTLYVPSAGIALLVALTLDALWTRSQSAGPWRTARTATIGLFGVLAGAALSRSLRWTEVWRNHDTLFAQMIAADSAGYRGYWLSGLEARRAGQTDDALALLGRAYSLYPKDRGLMIDYAETLLRSGQPARAASVAAELMSPSRRVRPFEVALYLDATGSAFGPDSVIAAGGRLMTSRPSATAALFVGRAHELRGDTVAAAAAYRAGLRVEPADSTLQLRLSILRVAR